MEPSTPYVRVYTSLVSYTVPTLVGMCGTPDTQLCYGGAWKHKDGLDDTVQSLFSVCTFYDKLLTLAELSYR